MIHAQVMDALKFKFEGPGSSIDMADGLLVMHAITDYLEAVTDAAIVSKQPRPSFSLPDWKPGSIRAGVDVRENVASAVAATILVNSHLSAPHRAPPGLRTAIGDARDSLLALPENTVVMVNGIGPATNLSELAQGETLHRIYTRETVRGRILRAGGRVSPTVRFVSDSNGLAFTLRATEEQAKLAGANLYVLAEARADLVRDADDVLLPILSGRIITLNPLADGPTFDQLRDWYHKVVEVHGDVSDDKH